MKFKIYVASLPFMFLSDKDLMIFLERLFSSCIERIKLYECLVEWNTSIIYQSCFDSSIQEEEQLKIVNSLEILEKSYSRFYDPEKQLFSSHNRIKYN